MNKSETKEIHKLGIYHELGLTDAVAMGLSALIRASMTKRSREALLAYADKFAVRNHPDFVI